MFASPHRGCVCHTVVTAAYSRKGKSDTSSCASPSWVLHLPNRTGYQIGGVEMAAAKGSPEEILGVRQGASQAEIRTAWRRLVRKHHPDRVAGNSAAVRAANRKMKEINVAAETLLNKEPAQGKQRASSRAANTTKSNSVSVIGSASGVTTRFSQLANRLPGHVWGTLLSLSVLAFIGYEKTPLATAPFDAESTFSNLLGIAAALLIPPRITRLRRMSPRGKTVIAALTLALGLLPWGLLTADGPLPQLASYLIAIALSIPNLIMELVDGVVQLLIGVAIAGVIIVGIITVVSKNDTINLMDDV